MTQTAHAHSRTPAPVWKRRLGLSEVWVRGDLSSQLLLILRWLAVLGQGMTLFVASELGVAIPWLPCGVALVLTLVSNSLLAWWLRQLGGHLGGGFFHIALWDALTLTWLLFWTGGLENPFSLFYLVQLIVAIVALRSFGAVGVAFLMMLSCVYLWHQHVPLQMQHGGPLPRHLLHQGGLAALILAGSFILALLLAVRRRSHVLQKERERLRLELESRDRFLSVAALATGFAHELATPIGTIALAADEMQAHPEAETAALIAREAARCQNVLQRLRELGQEALGQSSTPCCIQDVLQTCLTDLPETQRRRVKTHLPATATSPAVPCTGLREALLVMLRNALLSSPDEQPVDLRVRVESEQVHFIVEDHGPGFTPEMLAHWGEPFRSTRPAGEGMGLGLFFVRRLAASMQGTATVGNRAEGGARVTLILPIFDLTKSLPCYDDRPADRR